MQKKIKRKDFGLLWPLSKATLENSVENSLKTLDTQYR